MDIFGPSDGKEALAAGSGVDSAAEGILCFELAGCSSATIWRELAKRTRVRV